MARWDKLEFLSRKSVELLSSDLLSQDTKNSNGSDIDGKEEDLE